MKLQRYDADGDYLVDHTPNDNGEFCLSSDVESLEAENAALHAECDRLTAMLGPQKPMSAEEVIDPGFYWRRPIKDAQFEPVNIIKLKTAFSPLKMLMLEEEKEFPLTGQFIGPIRMPEVQG